MSGIEFAQETLERQKEELERKEANEEAKDKHNRRTALLVSVLAAVLALSEMAERGSQNSYMSDNIAVANDYAFYQARQTRALILNQTATMLTAQNPAPSPAVQKEITDAQNEANRITQDGEHGNGLRQLQARAEASSKQREVALHRYEWYEIVTSALQIAIVLASVSVVIQWRPIAYVGAAIGAVAAVVSLLVAGGVI